MGSFRVGVDLLWGLGWGWGCDLQVMIN